MKKFIILSLFTLIVTSAGYSQLRDTVINADINPNRKVEKVEVTFHEGYQYTLKVDNKEYKGEIVNGEYAYAQLIDMDDSDGYIEIAIIDVGPSDGHDAYMFRFTGDITHGLLGRKKAFLKKVSDIIAYDDYREPHLSGLWLITPGG